MDRKLRVILVGIWILTCSFWILLFPTIINNHEEVSHKLITFIQLIGFVNNTVWIVIYFIIHLFKGRYFGN